MASFYDMTHGFWKDVDTDPTPELVDPDEDNNEETTDRTNYTEPGAGDSFSGEDVSVWESEGNPEEPEKQTDQATAPIEIDSQSATVPDGGGTFGRNDDPDAKENVTDEEYGDDEDDTAKPEQTHVNVQQETEEYIQENDYFDEISYIDHLNKPEVSLKEDEDFSLIEIIEQSSTNPEIIQDNLPFIDLLQSTLGDIAPGQPFDDGISFIEQLSDQPEYIKISPTIRAFFRPATFNELWDSYLLLPGNEFVALPITEEFEEDDFSFLALSEDEYNIPGLGEELGSQDINDYIGDVSLYSLIEEFQFMDSEENDDLL